MPIHFGTLVIDEIMSIDAVVKTTSLLVRVASDAYPTVCPTVLLMERVSWSVDSIQHLISELNDVNDETMSVRSSGNGISRVALQEQNDRYYRYGNEDVRLTFIHPATEEAIAKYRQEARHILAETSEMYSNVTEPYYRRVGRRDLQWIDNALSGKAETPIADFAEWRILPDLKWNPQQACTLYLVALYRKPDLFSIRDLRGGHLSMLLQFRSDITHLLGARYGLQYRQVRCYFHYLPTYHHLHIHVVHCAVERPIGTAVGLAHLLDDVIENLEMDGEYYAKRTMYVSMSPSNALYALWTNKQ